MVGIPGLPGSPVGSAATPAALNAIVATALTVGSIYNVASLKANFAYDPTSVATVDNYFFIAAAGGGNWVRTAVAAVVTEPQTQAAIFIDPTNSTTTASDGNTNPSTIGAALLTYKEQARRWGGYAPRLRQSTAIQFLGPGHTDNSDPVPWDPYIESGGTPSIQGSITVVASVTLSGVVAKSRVAGANSPLIANLGASAAVGQLVRNTTTGKLSRAFVQKSLGANLYVLTQPMVPATLPQPALPAPAEVDTWANGDTVDLCTTSNVSFVRLRPTLCGNNASAVNTSNALTLSQLTVFDPGDGYPNSNHLEIGSHVQLQECNIQRVITASGITDYPISGLWFLNCIRFAQLTSVSGLIVFSGGSVQPSPSNQLDFISGATINYDADFILSALSFYRNAIIGMGHVYLDNAMFVQGSSVILNQNGSYGGHVLYGSASGSIQLFHTSHAKGVGAFVTSWTAPTLVSPGIKLNAASTGSSTSGNPAVINNGIATTVANLDAAAGAAGFGGTAFNLGGASVSNVY